MIEQHSTAYLRFTREQWGHFRQDMPLTLNESDLQKLSGQNEMVSLSEVEKVYLPLSRLLSFYVTGVQTLHKATSRFLGRPEPKVPYIIGIAGSVAVGKSTTSRVLQALLSRWPDHPNVSLVTTDAFLYPNAELEERGLMSRKGFPESYDVESLLALLDGIKSGKHKLQAPVYSHHHYDIVPGEFVTIDQPDIVIVEGLNILQVGAKRPGAQPTRFVSDFFDFTIFVDAKIDAIKKWFMDRLLLFRDSAFKDKEAYFHYLSSMTQEEMVKFGERVWHEINELNLIENILPYRERARLILNKADDHSVKEILLRKL